MQALREALVLEAVDRAIQVVLNGHVWPKPHGQMMRANWIYHRVRAVG